MSWVAACTLNELSLRSMFRKTGIESARPENTGTSSVLKKTSLLCYTFLVDQRSSVSPVPHDAVNLLKDFRQEEVDDYPAILGDHSCPLHPPVQQQSQQGRAAPVGRLQQVGRQVEQGVA